MQAAAKIEAPTAKTYTETTVGTHGTYSIGSDSYPVTVVAVHRNGLSIDVQFDDAKPNGGHSYYGTQRYMIVRNEKGSIERFCWQPSLRIYQKRGSRCGSLKLGTWHFYQDPSF